jgi:prepilin-type N-terminal cleavage/methylation domain-containing protein
MTDRSDQSSDRGSERGDTLIEVLMALMIIGIGVVALMSGLAASITGSAAHKSLTTTDTALKSAAETAVYAIELQPSPLFAQCASVSGTSYNGTAIPFNLPSNFTVTLSVQYWNQSTQKFEATTQTAQNCLNTANDQSGYQLLTVRVKGDSKLPMTLQVGLRNPN